MATDRNLGTRWKQSPYSSSILHARLKNFKDSAKDIQLELEADSAGKVYGTWRLAGEVFEVNEGEGLPGFGAASEATLRAVQKLFQDRNASNIVLDYLPFNTVRDIKAGFGVSISTASSWTGRKSGKPKQAMARRFINMALTIMGLKFNGGGSGAFVGLGEPCWLESKGEDNG